MAWRIEESVVRGEIDNRVRGQVTGRIWLSGRAEPIVLDLKGDAWRDLAGCRLRFINSDPVKADIRGLSTIQRGVVGDITASRKVKVPSCTRHELKKHISAGTPFPWKWGNAFYLEWFGETNGRVVIETTDYRLILEGESAWQMSEEDEVLRRELNEGALDEFMEKLTDGVSVSFDSEPDPVEHYDEVPPTAAEAEADADAARMDLLMNRIQARLEREGGGVDFERIMEEERERLRRERGEPDPVPLTPEEEEQRGLWIEELNAAARRKLADEDAEAWNESELHPLVSRCSRLSARLRDEVESGGWLLNNVSAEHPLEEVLCGVMLAGPKLAGALGCSLNGEWPPRAMMAGSVLVRLKKARGYLRDAVAGLDAADQEKLASPEWRRAARLEVTSVLDGVHQLIMEARAVLEGEE